jgi:hypothetical protein
MNTPTVFPNQTTLRRHALATSFGFAFFSALVTAHAAESPPTPSPSAPKVVQVAPTDAHATIDTAAAQRDIAALTKGTDAEKDAVVARILAKPGETAPPVFMYVAQRLHEKGDTAAAYRWFCFGLLRAQYDARRCADGTARQGVGIMTQNVPSEIKRHLGTLAPEAVQAFAQDILALDEATPYAYDHRWLNLHGMGAFTNTDGKKPLSLPESEWPALRKEAREAMATGLIEYGAMLRAEKSAPPAAVPGASPPPAPAVVSAPSPELRKQLPPAPEGFDWLVYKNCALLSPAGWNQKVRPDDPAKNLTGAFAISPEVFSEKKYFDHGFTVQIHTDVKRRFGAAASPSLAAFIQPLAAKVKKEDLLLFKEGGAAGGSTNILRYVDAPPGLTPLVVHRYFVANDAADTIHVFTYEAPQAQWEENWKTFGTPILGRVVMLTGAP